MSMSNSRAIAKMRAICPCGSLSVYGQPPIRSAPALQAAMSNSSAPGSFNRPSCGKTQMSRSIAQAIVRLQAADGVEAREPDARIDLHMGAHARGALHDRLLERAPRARIDVVLGEGALGGGDLRDRLLQGALLGPAAIENAGLVEMNVGLDEARDDQASADIFDRRIRRDGKRDRRRSGRRRCRCRRGRRCGRRCGHCG